GITTVYDCGPSQDGDGNLGVTVNDGSATYQGAMENCTYTFFGNMLVSGVLYKSNEITLTPVTPAISLTANGKNDTVTVTTGDTVTVNAIGNWEQQEPGLAYRLGLSDQSCALSANPIALIPTGPGEATFTWIPVTAGNYAVQAYWTLGDNAPLTSNCVLITVLTKTPGQTPSPSPSSTVSPGPTVSPTATSTTEPTASVTSTATSSPTGTTEPTSGATATGTAAATATTSAVTGLPSTGDGPGSGSMWIGSATVVAVALIIAGAFVYRINRSRS
ncbi:MAG: hypothetical protein KC435_05745, partial [Thermomicrobiales bacterium]|nr:hypothetical protein [Thermomicrobiales bacterium]